MPSLNVAKFYRQCMESVVNQTIEDIEIICVDAGSMDGTLEILEEYAAKDSRIVVIHSDKKSYGYQMNLGLDRAQGEFIGIVETDDWADPNMFESLYSLAERHKADFVKTNYYWYWTEENRSEVFYNLEKCPYGQVFRPLEHREIFDVTPSIWSGIYRREMLVRKKIRFNETPGASFQDTSFFFIVCAAADSCILSKEAFLHYRKDNAGSSVFSKSKTFCICEETRYVEAFLRKSPDLLRETAYFYEAWRYEKYRWNFSRLDGEAQQLFLPVMHEELRSASEKGRLQEEVFSAIEWEKVKLLIAKPLEYYSSFCAQYAQRDRVFDYYQPQLLAKSKAQNPVVSVIIPAYNASRCLRETLDSVAAQCPTGIWEIVAVDDGSEDDTRDILLEYAEKYDVITVLTQTNKGQGAARNAAIRNSKGEYVLFLDSDDLLAENAIQTLCNVALEKDLDLLHYNGEAFFENADLERRFPFYVTAYRYYFESNETMNGAELYCRMKKERAYSVSPCLAMYRKAYLEKNNIYFEEGIFHEDNYFTMRCLILAERVSHINDKVLLRRIHENSVMTSRKEFRHFYGYLRSIQNEAHLCETMVGNSDLGKYIVGEIRGISKNFCNTYYALPNRDRALKKLTPIELYYADLILNRNQVHQSPLKKMPVVRKIYGFFKCLKEHDLKYTFRRVLVHLHLVK